MAEKLTVGIVGAGYISLRRHIPAWQDVPDVDVVSIADLDEERVAEARSEFSIPNGFNDVKQMVDTVEPDIVDICTPPQTHADLGITAMEGGSHVLVEKPLALSLGDADRLVAAATENDRQLCTVHQMLFYPPVRRARRLVDAGEIGDVRGVRVFISTPADRYQLDEGSWIHEFEGGVLEETGPHTIYLSQPFVGDVNNVSIVGRKQTDAPWGKEDDFGVNLVGSSATSSIRIIHHADFRSAEVDVWGKTGRLKIDLQTMNLHKFSRPSLGNAELARSAVVEGIDKIGSTIGNGIKTVTGRFKSGHETVIEQFARSVRLGTEPPVSADHARENVRILEKCVNHLDR